MPALMAAIDALLMIEPPPWSFMYRPQLRADDHPEEVHVHDAGEVFEIVRQEPLQRAADPGVVEHDVEPAEALDREVDQACTWSASLTSVCLNAAAAPICSASSRPLRVDVPDHDARPLGHEQLGCRPADPAGATGHDGHLPYEFPCLHAATLRSRSKCCRRDGARSDLGNRLRRPARTAGRGPGILSSPVPADRRRRRTGR